MSLAPMRNISSLEDKYFFHVPYAHIIADYIWPGLIMSPSRVIDVRKEKFTADDVLIASYPKSGKPRTRGLLSRICCLQGPRG